MDLGETRIYRSGYSGKRMEDDDDRREIWEKGYSSDIRKLNNKGVGNSSINNTPKKLNISKRLA